MTVTKTKPRFDVKKMDNAAAALRSVAIALDQFQKAWGTLSVAEKLATGGIVFNYVSYWEHFDRVGSLVVPPIGTALINGLAHFHNTPPDKRQPPKVSGIKPCLDG